jgi:hypothetical protein
VRGSELARDLIHCQAYCNRDSTSEPATRHVVGNTQSLTGLRGLIRHPTGRGYAGCCKLTSQNSPSTTFVHKGRKEGRGSPLCTQALLLF